MNSPISICDQPTILHGIARIAPIAKSTDQDTVPPVSQLAHNNYKAYTDLLLP